MGFVFLWNESSGIQVGEGMALLFGSNALHSILIISVLFLQEFLHF
jgi:hypothetical protein